MKTIKCFILFLVFFQFNSYSQELLLTFNNSTFCVSLKNDSAIIDYFIIDKPNLYFRYDTLFRKNEEYYIGSRTQITKSGDSYFLVLENFNDKKRTFKLSSFTKKQIKKRNLRHNSFLYDLNNKIVKQKKEFYLSSKNNNKLAENIE
ncbi:MAG: hypothetical protein KA275_02170, partial [Chitinophagaceae bacterium]|nr:hypothetical protein [Chitinophagaceae bacterium]